MTLTLQRSPLHDLHVAAGARLIDFYGWHLPVQYTSIIDEHQTVRQAAGLFDISHMGQLLVSGSKAFDFLQSLTTSDMRRTWDKGIGVYAHLCRPEGGVIDDIFVYGRKSAQEFFVVVNGATHQKDVEWFRQHATDDVTIIDLENRGGLAIQGPKALDIIRQTIAGIAELPRFAFQRISGAGPQDSFWGCRTGYTGEEGAEFFGPASTIFTLWKQLMENGADSGLKPCGLGARDTLRLEMGYPLYGHELNEQRTSLESSMEWAVKWPKGDFIGRAALEKQKRDGLREQLIAYELLERGVPRHGAKVFREGTLGGETTSGTFSPSLQKGIGLVFAPISWNNPGTRLEVEIHQKRVPAQVVTLPFFKR
ncbi:MAG: glycine cleavage system aminomethyltransferase GcvT [Elusimicrobiota bacterium]|jgi:aminomethyltransferase